MDRHFNTAIWCYSFGGGLSFLAFEHLVKITHLHPVFALLISGVPSLLFIFLLSKSNILRRVYFGIIAVCLSCAVYYYVRYFSAHDHSLGEVSGDPIWAGFFAVIALIFGLLFTRYISRSAKSNDNPGLDFQDRF